MDRHAKKAGINFLARFRHVPEPFFGGGIAGVDRTGEFRDASDQTLTNPHTGDVDRLGFQALGRAEFQSFGIPEQIDRTDLGAHGIRNNMRDPVKTLLTGAVQS